MNAFLRRLERVRTSLVGRQASQATLVYADGTQTSVSILEAVSELCKREDVVDILAQDDTTSSLLQGLLGPWDFSDLGELEGE